MIPEAIIMAERKIPKIGALCIGAHHCEELADYKAMGFKQIWFVEANPNILHNGTQSSLIAVGWFNGPVPFYLMSDDQCSSLLKPKEHLRIYPHIRQTDTVTVECETLDRLLDGVTDYNFLHMDIQGAEGAVLKASESWKRFDMLSLEVNFIEMYEGCMLEPELTAMIEAAGFRKVWMDVNPCGGWGGAIYVRSPTDGQAGHSM